MTPRPLDRTSRDLRDVLLEELHGFEWTALSPALCETVRLLESPSFEQLTDAHVLEVANYRPVALGDEIFFERAFTGGKEAAASLGFARLLGREAVLDDLLRLRDALGYRCLRDPTGGGASPSRETMSA